MNLAALLALMATGLAGIFLLAIVLGLEGHGPESAANRLPSALIVGHVGAAIVFLGLWILVVTIDARVLVLSAAVVVVLVVALGLWLLRTSLVHRGHEPAAELPTAGIVIHGALATVTVILVALAVGHA